MKYKWPAILILISFIAQQCAKQTVPTGGPKDETPPTLIRSIPTNEQTNFTKGELELTFDELIQLNNASEQIIITPSVGKKFEALAKKNKVTLKLNATLLPNTTYNINFRESIQDITEKNPAKAKIAFSTGSYIDSLSITGSVYDILTDKEASNYTIALTEATDTFNIYKHPGSWITLTNKKGRFILENLKQGTYILYTFDDRNRNIIADSKSEKHGFKSGVINLDKNLDSVRLYSYKIDTSPIKLISSRPTFNYFNIRLSKSITNYSLTDPADSLHLYSMIDTDLSTIKVYNSFGSFDSLQIRLQATDSIQSKIDTLLYMKFNKKESTKDKLVAKIESSNLYEDNSMLSIIVSFSKPMTYLNSDSVYIQEDSLTRITFTKNDLSWNESQTKLTISKRHEIKPAEPPKNTGPQSKTKAVVTSEDSSKPPKVYNQLVLAKGSFISVENDTITRITSQLKIVRKQDTGIIITKVDCTENFILHLVDRNMQVIDAVINEKEYRFTNLPAGVYLLRLLIDKNKNEKWDAGNFSSKTDAEPTVFYKNPKGLKEINLKANWEVGPLLISY